MPLCRRASRSTRPKASATFRVRMIVSMCHCGRETHGLKRRRQTVDGLMIDVAVGANTQYDTNTAAGCWVRSLHEEGAELVAVSVAKIPGVEAATARTCRSLALAAE